jgi:lichenysin synthetase B
LANPTIEELACLLRGRAASTGPRITPVPPRPFYPVTFQQQGIYAEQQKDTAATQYNVPIVIDVPYCADPARLREAVRALVARHEVLRTTFVPVGNDVVALVQDYAEVPVEMLAGPPGPGFVRPFDLAAGPLLRVGLHRGRTGSHIAIDVHHIAVDGITMGLLLDDLTALYDGTELAPPPLRYADYAVWQRSEDARRLREQQEPFWLEKFAEPPPAPALPADFQRAPVRDIRGSLLEFDLGPERGMRLRECSRRLGVTLFHTLAAVYFLFLARITGEHDLTAGTPVTGRTAPELAQVAGLFTNTLCLRARISPAQAFTDFARTVSRGIVEMAQHQDYPFGQLADRVATQRDYARNPLFDTMIAYQDTGLIARAAMGGRACPGDSINPHTMFDLNLQVYETGQSLSAAWGYSTALFLDKTVRLFRDNLLEVMDAVLADPERCAGELISSPITVQELHPVTEFNFGDQKERRKADGGF